MGEMPPEDSAAHDQSLTRLRQRVACVLAWERLWPDLWPALGLGGLFVSLALLNLFRLLPPWLHGAILALFALSISLVLLRAAWRFSWPSPAEIDRRIEDDNALSPHLLSSLNDHPAVGDNALWRHHLHSLRMATRRLKSAFPHSTLPRHDPWGVRVGVALLCVVAISVAWEESGERLQQALFLDPAGTQSVPVLQIWITPPDYMRLPPLSVALPTAEQDESPLVIAQGSILSASLYGGRGRGRAIIDENDLAFHDGPDGAQRLDFPITAGKDLTIRQGGRVVARWPLQIVIDQAPTIALDEIKTNARRQSRFSYRAQDDYGLSHLWLNFSRIGPMGEMDYRLALPDPKGKTTQQTLWRDLTSHPWAGYEVVIEAWATDHSGQRAHSGPVLIRLPERLFKHKVAREVIALRRRLIDELDSLAMRGDVAERLQAITAEPQRFDGDLIVYMSLEVARYRLERDLDPMAIAQVQDLLWQIALRIEEGEQPFLEQRLEQARQDLDKALSDPNHGQDNQQDDSIEERLSEYERRLDAVTGTLSEDQREQIERDKQTLRDLAQTGSPEAAKQRLQALSDHLQQALNAQSPERQQAQQLEKQLRDLAQRQRDLIDRGQADAPARLPDTLGQQQTLHDDLEQRLGQKYGGDREVEESLAQARSAMQTALDRLRRGDLDQAREAQNDAAQRLEEGLSHLAEQSMPPIFTNDPMGQKGSGGDDGSVRLPEQGEISRAREILQELRRRAGESERPAPEQDYLQRLLDLF